MMRPDGISITLTRDAPLTWFRPRMAMKPVVERLAPAIERFSVVVLRADEARRRRIYRSMSA